jgi:hypothetical protein
MAAVQGYSHEHQFALEQMFPQATLLSVKVTPNTDHIDQISDLYISQKLQ